MKFETIDLDGLAVIAHVEHGEIWLFLDDLSKEFNLPVEDFLAWPKVEEFLFSLMFEHGLTDPAETQTYFDRLVRSTREPPYRGIWLSEPLALEFVGVCHPALRYRLQQWLACRFAAERQAPGRHLAEARHDKTFH